MKYVLLVGVACTVILCGQSEAPVQPLQTVIRSSTREVLLDVVVRKKDMQMARKLKASDFQIREDGVPQKINTFRFVSGAETLAAAPSSVSAMTKPGAGPVLPASSNLLEEPRFISIVFEQVSPNSRKYAQDAVNAFLKQELRTDTYVAVLAINNRVSPIQSFTNKPELLEKAVQRAANGNYASGEGGNILNQADYITISDINGIHTVTNVNLTQSPDLSLSGAELPPLTGAATDAANFQGQQRDTQMYHAGMRSMDSLRLLVQYESALPGRKTVIYVSEGLTVPPGPQDSLNNVIKAANRANVSFYAVDPRGVQIGDANSFGRNRLTGIASNSQGQTKVGGVITSGQSHQQDDMLEVSVGNTQLNMLELATKTGGFAVMNTDEIEKGMLQVMEDVRTHYEISYVPTSAVYDGRFRHVEVKVSDPKLIVQSRDGYFALPDVDGRPVQLFEVKALRTLDSKTPSKSFPLFLSALRFAPVDGGVRYEIAFDMPIANLTPQMDSERHMARLRATFLALVKDSRGEVVGKVSRDVDEPIPADRIESVRKGRISFTAPIDLRPGRYTVEGVALDVPTGNAATTRVAAVVTPSNLLSVSQVTVIRGLTPLKAARNARDPLELPSGRITPELASSMSAETPLFFVVYPASGGTKPKVRIQLLRDGKQVSSSEPAVSAPDETNSIPIIASAKLPPGQYEVWVTVEQDGKKTREASSFTVAPL